MMNKFLNVQTLLWAALILALVGSLRHMAATFASVDDNAISGWVQAIAIDFGLVGLSYSLRIRKEQKRSVKVIWLGVVLFSSISVFGNWSYGIIAISGQLPPWMLAAKPIILAASLPVLVLYLSELVSDDKQHANNEAAKEAKRQAKVDRQKGNDKGQDGAKLTFEPGNLDRANEAKAAKIDRRREMVLTLKEQDFTHQEIADQVGVSLGTVKNDLKALLNGKAQS